MRRPAWALQSSSPVESACSQRCVLACRVGVGYSVECGIRAPCRSEIHSRATCIVITVLPFVILVVNTTQHFKVPLLYFVCFCIHHSHLLSTPFIHAGDSLLEECNAACCDQRSGPLQSACWLLSQGGSRGQSPPTFLWRAHTLCTASLQKQPALGNVQ